MRKCSTGEECFYDEDDGELYCREGGRYDPLGMDKDTDYEHEPEWCPKNKA